MYYNVAIESRVPLLTNSGLKPQTPVPRNSPSAVTIPEDPPSYSDEDNDDDDDDVEDITLLVEEPVRKEESVTTETQINKSIDQDPSQAIADPVGISEDYLEIHYVAIIRSLIRF
jgi:hypothetical protein